MAVAEFEEKSYEIAACAELARGVGPELGQVFAPGQVLEERLGYDAAASVPQDHELWTVLDTPRPAGVRLLPEFWSGGKRPRQQQLPSSVVSLILQFKRPEYLRSAAAAQWRYWHQPYYRFARRDPQHHVLRRLERSVDDRVCVRYAAPAFWRWGELEGAQLDGGVLRRSGFVAPQALDRHRAWTYVRPGSDGRANPQGTPRAFARLDELLANITTDSTSTAIEVADPIGNHIFQLGETATSVLPTKLRSGLEGWLRRSNVDSLEEADLVRSLARVSTLLSFSGATWWLVAK